MDVVVDVGGHVVVDHLEKQEKKDDRKEQVGGYDLLGTMVFATLEHEVRTIYGSRFGRERASNKQMEQTRKKKRQVQWYTSSCEDASPSLQIARPRVFRTDFIVSDHRPSGGHKPGKEKIQNASSAQTIFPSNKCTLV